MQVEGEYFDAQNRPDLALERYKLAVQKQPDVASTHYVLGSAYWVRFRSEDAEAEFRATIKLSPEHYMARYKLGMILLEQGHPSRSGHGVSGRADSATGLRRCAFRFGKSSVSAGSDGGGAYRRSSVASRSTLGGSRHIFSIPDSSQVGTRCRCRYGAGEV